MKIMNNYANIEYHQIIYYTALTLSNVQQETTNHPNDHSHNLNQFPVLLIFISAEICRVLLNMPNTSDMGIFESLLPNECE